MPQHDHYAFHPQVQEMTLNTPGRWKLLGAQDRAAAQVSATGRMIGGCVETVSMLPGSPYGDVADFAARHAPEGLLIYVEVAETDAVTAARMLHHLRPGAQHMAAIRPLRIRFRHVVTFLLDPATTDPFEALLGLRGDPSAEMPRMDDYLSRR